MNSYLEKWAEWVPANNPGWDILTTSPMIHGLIQKLLPMGQTFVEWGYGTGYTTIALANQKRQVVGYDPAEGLMGAAIEARDKHLVSNSGQVHFTHDEYFLPHVDVVYSQGLLEHFDNEGVVKIIHRMIQYADAVVFSVPSENYPQQDFGDERLMNIAEWEHILEPFKDQLKQLYYYERRQHLMGVIRNDR
jgi:2-polyprenyl-3-methyl-5-hydroxy-6-metoxy-1,4-benzoquinol methylase